MSEMVEKRQNFKLGIQVDIQSGYSKWVFTF
nr:MAG TPA: hypothetical protein [Caudoviricetes sp.]